MKKCFFLFLFVVILISPNLSFAQELVQDESEIVKAEVLEVLGQKNITIPSTDTPGFSQTIVVKILEGDKIGETVTIENDYIMLEKGDKFFLFHSIDSFDGIDRYTVHDLDRKPVVIFFVFLFIAVVLFFSGKQGLRSLLGLLGSFLVIFYILIPSLLKGYPPILTSIVVATAILFFAIYLTHGFNRISTVAFSGTVLAVILTGILAYIGVKLAHFTGFATEEAFYLNLNTRGTLDFTGLLLGGIIIGVLGVLDDIAITQAAVVRELFHSAPHISKKEVYKKALRVGREHVGALVNTLALAYTGASLPLLLLFFSTDSSMSDIINREIFATEIIRTVVGSIGLIMTVPITTFLAVYFLKNYDGEINSSSHIGHSH
ncbi:MAG: YibE/F family protein [Candidatus Pacebacteria bacterium]|nr:YibE/F family protein [Candidatus Paceibacterota bacterium]